jgi:hypothetical protein
VQSTQGPVALGALLSAIIDWEKELEYVERVHQSLGKVFAMDDEDRRLHIINMCPRDLSDFLLRETERFCSYTKVRAEIVEHIARGKRQPRGAVHALENAELHCGDRQDTGEDAMEDLDDEERAYVASLACLGDGHQQSVLAIVRNSKFKAKGGKGKGKKGIKGEKGDKDASQGKGPKDGCFNCGGDHFIRECPHPP